MERLFDIYERVFEDHLNKYRWWYYSSLDKNDFCCSINNLFYNKNNYVNYADILISTIYHAGVKDNFFIDIQDELSERSQHMISAFFLGHYIARDIEAFDELCNDSQFSWLWFLCCLYHDTYFLNESSHKHTHYSPKYFSDSKGLLYSKRTIEKYRKYRLSNKYYDHGIYAAAAFSCHYKELFDDSKKEKTQRKYDLKGLVINDERLKVANNIAKVIASHNIFLAQDKLTIEQYKSAGLEELIPTAGKNIKMPKDNSKFSTLFLLLSLVDILEPIKRNIDLKQIELEVKNRNTINITIDLRDNLFDCNRYFMNIIDAETWLNNIGIKYYKKDLVIEVSIFVDV